MAIQPTAQQNPQQQRTSVWNRQQQQVSGAVSPQPQQPQGGFASWMQQRNDPSKIPASQPQAAPQPQQGGQQPATQAAPGPNTQPTSPVMSNGKLSTTPISFAPPQSYAAPIMANPLQQPIKSMAEAHPIISQNYQNMFGRPPRQDELDAWGAALIHGGRTPQDMVAALQQQGGAGQYNPMAVPGNVSYNQTDFSAIQGPGSYNPTQFNQQPISQYNFNPNNIGQYQNANVGGLDAQTQGLFDQLVAQGGRLPVEQLKAQQADTANELYRGQSDQARQAMASRGLAGGGQDVGAQMQIGDQRNQQILGAYRDIDIQDQLSQRDALSQAVGLGDSLAGNRVQRNIGQYQAGLAGQTAREGFTQGAADSAQRADQLGMQREGMQADENYRGWGTQMDNARFNMDRATQTDAQERFKTGTAQDVWNTQNQNYFNQQGNNLNQMLGSEGLKLDDRRAGLTEQQAKFSNLMDMLSFGENQRQFNKGFGLQSQVAGNNQQNEALRIALSKQGMDDNLVRYLMGG